MSSDYDILLIANRDTLGFWPALPKVAEFVAALANNVAKKSGLPVVVASSLAAEDLMPFVAAQGETDDSENTRECVVIHALLYPTIEHLIAWEQPAVRTGLLLPFRAGRTDHVLIGTLPRPTNGAATPDDAEAAWESPIRPLQEADISVQAFTAGIVQAHCHRLYQWVFTERYASHLLRYAARYLLDADNRKYDTDKKFDSEIRPYPSVVADKSDDPEGARRVLRWWLTAWKNRQRLPHAWRLSALYGTAGVYFQDVYRRLASSQPTRPGGFVRETVAPWKDAEAMKRLRAIIEADPRPTFVVWKDRILKNVSESSQFLSSSLRVTPKVWFSTKAFPSPDLAMYLSKENPGIGFSIASHRELEMVTQAGIKRDSLLLHAPAFDESLLAAITSGAVGTVSVGSPIQHERLLNTKPHWKWPKSLLRIRVPRAAHSKFGMSPKEATEIIRQRGEDAPTGIHIHLGELLYSEEVVHETAQVLAEVLVHLLGRDQIPVVNLGGGWRSTTFEEWYSLDGLKHIVMLVEELRDLSRAGRRDFSLCFEFGHRLVEDAVVAACHVLETRDTETGCMHILDSGASVLPLLHSAAYGVTRVRANPSVAGRLGSLAGPACYEADRFPGAKLEMSEGDLVVFSNAGTYTLALASEFGMNLPDIKAFSLKETDASSAVDWHLW